MSIAGRQFPGAGDAAPTLDLGGFSKELEPNGDAQSGRWIKTPKPWKAESVVIAIDHERNDLQFLQEQSNSHTNEPCKIELCTGEVYQGSGSVMGDVKVALDKATAEIMLGGPGELTLQ
ncbi:MAG TPA: hypothetical protein VIM73_19535 [Polyangiaceae bacterium]